MTVIHLDAQGTVSPLGDDDLAGVTGLALPYGQVSHATGGARWRFSGGPQGDVQGVPLLRDHDHGAPVGRVTWASTTDGIRITGRLLDSQLGRDTATEIRAGLRTGMSIGARILHAEMTDDGIMDVAAGDYELDHIALTAVPAYPATTSTVTASREDLMPAPATIDQPAGQAQADTVQLDSSAATVSLAELTAAVAAQLSDQAPQTHPLAQWSSAGEWWHAMLSAEPADQAGMVAMLAAGDHTTTTGQPLLPHWTADLRAHLDERQPLLSRIGRTGVEGMTVVWPRLDPALDLTAVVRRQTAELADLATMDLALQQGQATVVSAGVATRQSYQLARLAPGYLDLLLRILQTGWARYEEAQAVAQVMAAGTQAGALPDVSTPARAHAWLLASAADVEDAIGAPPDIVLVDRATWIALGSLEYPQTVSPAGETSAAQLRVRVSGLEVVRGIGLPASTAVVMHSSAATMASTGPIVATGEDVRRLGRDIALWGMHATGLVAPEPGGIRVYTS